AACAVLMAVTWISEAIPLAATALIPVVLFPLFGILDAKKVALTYADPNVFLFMGGFMIAMAMQRHNLHKRIALNIIRIIGTSAKKIVLGFMLATGFLSMWISNTATAMMMLPIGLAIIDHAYELETENNRTKPARENFRFGIALMLGIAYSASIGGIGTIIGTPPNIIFAGISGSMFPDMPQIGFTEWMIIGIPIVIIFLPLTWFYLVHIGIPLKNFSITGGKSIIEKEIAALGKMKFPEKVTLLVFILTAIGWIFRKDIQLGDILIRGWTTRLGIESYVHDGTIAMAGALLLFVIPTDIRKNEFVLNWEWARRIPWGILILFGGGFALAAGFRETGLDLWIGNAFGTIHYHSVLLLVVSVCILLTFLTEVTSNTATITMMLPVLAAMAVSLDVHPFALMIPATIATSFAFMMPVATPPNAIVFGSGFLKIKDMARVGVVLNILGVIAITLFMYLVVFPLFGIAMKAIVQ
ncbi:MAG: SLC13 family permease, partial [Bacteroidales bacterium]